jgi:F0F1-type ATP synthase assembly protein I
VPESGKKPFSVLVGEYTALAFMLPAATFVGYAIGYGLDRVFGTDWLYIPFLILGIAAGFVQLIRQLMRDTKDAGS